MRDRNRILTETIKRLLRRGATSNLSKIINKAHASDLSQVFRELSANAQRRLFNMIEDPEQQATLLAQVDESLMGNLIEGLRLDELVEIFEEMASDDVADLLSKMPQDKADAILARMEEEGSEAVEGLLSYGDDTAGGIMVAEFIALEQDTTASEAIQVIQKEHEDVEMVFYIYVVDENGKLLGVVSLRQLVVEKPNTPLRDFMATDVFSVNTHMDQEEVAKIVAQYDILAVPVVDDNNELVGVVTVDDVIDIIRLEATEDMLKMAGAGEAFVETQTIFKSVRIRLPWLFASAFGGVLASFIISGFETSLARLAYLAAFIPIIMGMGGNIGTQSSTIVVRGLATGRLLIKDIWKVVSKELAIGFLLGIVYGAIIGGVAEFRFFAKATSEEFAISVGLAVLSSMSVAALVGSLVPMVLAKLKLDPAVATGPFVTTAVDIVSVYCYFIIATTLIGL